MEEIYDQAGFVAFLYNAMTEEQRDIFFPKSKDDKPLYSYSCEIIDLSENKL